MSGWRMQRRMLLRTANLHSLARYGYGWDDRRGGASNTNRSIKGCRDPAAEMLAGEPSLSQITRSIISLCQNRSGVVTLFVGLISHAGLMESIMRTRWNGGWIGTVIPAVLLGSAAFGQTKGGWVDPPADLLARPAQASELSSAVQAKPARTESHLLL